MSPQPARGAPHPAGAGFFLLVGACIVVISGCEGDTNGATTEPAPGQPVYEAEVRPDPETGTLSARWRIAFVTDSPPSASVAFLLASELDIERLEGEGIRGHRTEPSQAIPVWQQVIVELDEDRGDGPIVMELEYSGRPVFSPSGINRIAPDWVELSVDSGWHPLFATFDQEMTGVLRVALPEEWDVVASGQVSFEEGYHVVRHAEPELDVTFAGAPSLDRAASGRLTLFHRGEDPETVRLVLDAAESCADYLNERYGRDDPLPLGVLLMADRSESAYARLGYIVLSHVDPSAPIDLSRFLCHELAHYWARGADFTTVHHWMSEAFAEYVAARYVRERYGQESFDELITRWDEASRNHGPVWTEEMTARGSDVLMYRRAPVLLSRLEDRIGEERFDRFLERYMTRGVATTRALLEHLEAVAGPEAAEAFRALLASGPHEA
jgi:hypothetical protein